MIYFVHILWYIYVFFTHDTFRAYFSLTYDSDAWIVIKFSRSFNSTVSERKVNNLDIFILSYITE
jgi:hypothetical protein